jgi:hypothetical protein
MTFEELLDQVLDMLQRRGRVSYRAVQRQFDLDDATLEDVKADLLYRPSRAGGGRRPWPELDGGGWCSPDHTNQLAPGPTSASRR